MEPEALLETDFDVQAYRLERVELEHASQSVLDAWNNLLKRRASSSLMHDPRWLRECLAKEGSIFVFLLYRGDQLCGLAPFLIKDWPLKCELGEVKMARLPLKRLRLLGGAPHFPEEAAAYELLFRELLHLPERFDALYLEDVAVESPFWKFAETNPFVLRSFSRYLPAPPAPRVMLRLQGSFDEYLVTFSSKHRQTLRRKARRFHDLAPGETRTARYTSAEEVDAFLERAVEISRKTYQWNLLNGGLRNVEQCRQRFAFLAQNGWLRSYILFSRTTACAFLVGYQYGGRFYLDDMGYDPEWKDLSVGTVLQLSIIEDLLAENRPDVYDLGEYGPHKEEFANQNYVQGSVLLFRRSLYTGLVTASHRACLSATTVASGLLDRFGWKQKLKKLIRNRSSSSK